MACNPDATPPAPPPTPLACQPSGSFSNNETTLVDSANSKIYVFVNSNLTYSGASSACTSMASSTGTVGTLVCYGSYQEQHMVESYFWRAGPLRPYWLGLRQPTLGSGSW